MSVVDRLRQNDPARTNFYIILRYEPSDADLAQALQHNPYVTVVAFGLNGEQGADWTSLLCVIARRVGLEKVILEGAEWAERRNASLVRSILRAIQQNTAIRSVEMEWLCLPTDIFTFVDNVSSITSFSLCGCDMDPAERQLGARRLTAAIQRNTNIETMSLRKLDDICTIAI